MKNIYSLSFLLALLSYVTIFPASAGASERVVLQLAWKHQFQFAGYYAALHKGFYTEAGLDVVIVEGGEGKFAREQVKENHAQYGIAGSELLLHRADGDPFVVLAAILQHSPSVLLTRSDSDIFTLHDLIGKKVMLLPGKKDADILAAFNNEGIPLTAINRLDQTYRLSDLIDGTTDAVSAYETNEPWFLQQSGIEPAVISPRAYGVDFYSDCLFTTEAELKSHPQRVRQFLQASLQGWQYAIDHPQEVIDILLNQYKVAKSPEHLQFEAEAIERNMRPDFVQIGHMNPGRWKHIHRTYASLGMIDPGFSLQGFLYDPDPEIHLGWLWWSLGFGALITVAAGTGAVFLYLFNKRLAAEVAERRQVERSLKNSEFRYKQAQAISKAGNWEYDFINEKFWGSEQAKRIYGFDPETDHFTTEDVEGCIPEREKVHQSLVDLIEKNIPYDIEFEIHPVSGPAQRIIRSIAELERDDEGNPVKVVGVIQDITQEKITESEKIILERKLLQAQKLESIGNLAGGIAHDFNNILSSILGFTELALMEVKKKSDLEDNLQEVYAAGIRAKDLVKQILAFARQSDEEKRPVRLSTITSEVVKFIRSTIPSSIEVRENIESQSLVIGNATQLHQVLMNLCTNAAHAMHDSGGTLEIILRDVSANISPVWQGLHLPPGDYAELIVTDTGIGIDEEIIDVIFEPYFTTKGVGEGTGLGLAMVKGIVEDHGGAITVVNNNGEKTSFTVYLPVTASRQDQKVYIKETLPMGNEKILFVDDEPAIAKMGSRILESLGYAVTSRTSSYEALELFKKKPEVFDLVITDMTMPQMTGDVLASELLRVRADIPIILCTGYSSRISVEYLEALSVKALIYKPLVKADFARTVRKVLDETGEQRGELKR
jgi:signal transduction histidine kinase/ABC-type nitrate/sulfonate/bicarbonate transport system substrate-binding protein/ActR/RegA family two-component response regulator